MDDELIGPSGAEVDTSRQIYAAQEPHDQATNASFYLGLTDSGGKQAEIWLRGLYYDTVNSQWVVQQHRESSSPFDLTGMDLPSTALEFHESSAAPQPLTPSATWGPSGTAEGPRAFSGFFSSAVLTKDANTQWRIFAAHTVRPDDAGSPSDQWAVQWYVIDPKVAICRPRRSARRRRERWRLLPPDDRGDPTGRVLHRVHLLGRRDVARGAPRATQHQLHDGGSEVTLQTGPATAHVGPSWGDYADMQVDPTNPCSFWSVHTLFGDLPDPTQDPVSIDERDVWLFEPGFGCLNANLNGDSVVDLYDMALFNDYYATGARRLDMNTDGTTDATLYDAAYEDQKD